jgi:hypothetical protein
MPWAKVHHVNRIGLDMAVLLVATMVYALSRRAPGIPFLREDVTRSLSTPPWLGGVAAHFLSFAHTVTFALLTSAVTRGGRLAAMSPNWGVYDG